MARRSDKGRSQAANPREIELKLEAPPEEIARIAALPFLAEAAPASDQTGRLSATYFDTPKHEFRKAGLSVRLRRKGDETVQTIKAEQGARGIVLDRNEWEVPVRGDGLDLKAAAKTALKPFLADGCDEIRPAFTVESDRLAYEVRRDGVVVEVVLDDVRVSAGEKSRRFGEVEIELKDGEPRRLFDIALDLVEAAPLRLSLETKAERGYELVEEEPPRAVKAQRIKLDPRMTSGEAFRTIARSCLVQIVRNEALIRRTREPLALHQMRVGLRRLRAAASLFRDLLSDEESAAIRAELRWMNHALGPVRDLDVLVRRMRETPESGRARGHGKVLAAAERRRKEAYEHVLGLLEEVRFRRGMLCAAAWIESGSWLRADPAEQRKARDQPIVERAAAELGRRRKKVLKRARHLAELDPEARHRVRIEIKKLRYGVEFFGSLFSGGKVAGRRRQTLDALESLQEVLGELNDIAMGGHIFAPPPGEGEEPRDLEAGDLLARAQSLVGGLGETKPFWK
jgi:triphosphatase